MAYIHRNDDFFIKRDSNFDLLRPENRELLEHAWLVNEEGIYDSVRRGAYVHIVGEGGWTALTLSAKKGHAGCVKMLLEMGSDANSLIMNGKTVRTPLLEAANNSDVIKLLVDYGADCKVLNSCRQTPLILACNRKNINLDVLKTLIPKSDVNHQDYEGCTALMRLALNNSVDCASYIPLLEANANVELTNRNGRSVIDILFARDRLINFALVDLLKQARDHQQLSGLIEPELDDPAGMSF